MKPPTLNPGDLLDGKYAIRRVLGEGGMGVVYEAQHTKLDQAVAIKVMLPEMLSEPALVQRFEREARAAAKLRSRNVARVYDVDATADGLPYIVMELLRGQDLADFLAIEKQLPVGQAVHIVLQVCAAIHEAHRAGIIHRDLKPANIFLATEGERVTAKVLDFGISKDLIGGSHLTREHGVIGTVLYMSPEQVRNEGVDQRSDIWALGAMLYEMLAGARPFDGPVTKVAAAIVSQEPLSLRGLRPDLPPGLDDVVARMLAKDPAERYPDVLSLVDALVPYSPSQTAAPYLDDADRRVDSEPQLARPDLTADTLDAKDRVRAPRIETAAGLSTEPLLTTRKRTRVWVVGATLLITGVIATGGLVAIRPVGTARPDDGAKTPTTTVDPAPITTPEEPRTVITPGPIATTSAAASIASTVREEDAGAHPTPAGPRSKRKPASTPSPNPNPNPPTPGRPANSGTVAPFHL